MREGATPQTAKGLYLSSAHGVPDSRQVWVACDTEKEREGMRGPYTEWEREGLQQKGTVGI